MQMIRAIIRPEKVDDVIIALDDEQFHSVTVMDAEGRGIQKGLNKGDEHFDQLPKKLLILVVEDEDVDFVVDLISEEAFTGNPGDGKIFVSPVLEAYTVRTRSQGL